MRWTRASAKRGARRKDVAGHVERVPEEFEAEFVTARRKFIDAAQRVVGADLTALR